MVRFFASLVLVLVFSFGVTAQDSITPNGVPESINTSIVTGPDKILTWAKYVALGEQTAVSGESVESAITRLRADVASLGGGSGSVDVSVQFSRDGGTTWVETRTGATSWRFRVGTGAWSPALPLIEANVDIDTDIEVQYTTDDGISRYASHTEATSWRFRVGSGEWSAWISLEHTVRVQDIVGFDAAVERVIDLEELASGYGPLWTKPARQLLRVGTPFSLDLNTYVDEANTFSATNLPDGILVSTRGIVSGTPTREQNVFPTFTATSQNGTSTVSFAFFVLRRAMFDAGHIQSLEGLTVKGSNVVALDRRGYIYFFNAETGAAGDETTITLSPSPTTIVDYSGIAWNGTDFTVLGQESGDTGFSLMRFVGNNDINSRVTGSQVAPGVSSNRLSGAEGLAWQSPASANAVSYWVVGDVASLHPQLSQFSSAFGTAGLTAYPLAPTTLEPMGVVRVEDVDDDGNPVHRLYVVDASTNSVRIFSETGTQGTHERYREFSLVTANNLPRGITEKDGYLYVLNRAAQAAGGVHDSVFIYPDKQLWDADVPDLVQLAFVGQGPYLTNHYVRVRATFSGPVDISSDVTLRLNVGGTERQAISVADASGTTTATAQQDTSAAYFVYQIQSDDTDADGIETYPMPFHTVGTISPHENALASHQLNGSTAFQVRQPGGLHTLGPRPSHRVNAGGQPSFTETNADSDDYISGVPAWMRQSGDADGVSLANFSWVRQTGTAIEFNQSSISPTSQSAAQMEGANGWQDRKTVSGAGYLYMRVEQASVGLLAKTWLLNDSTQALLYSRVLGHVVADSATWQPLNGGQVFNGHFYYGLKQTFGVQTTVAAYARQLPYADVSGTPTIPPAQVQADLNVTDTASKAFVKGQDKFTDRLGLVYHGTLANITLNYGGEGTEATIDIPQDLQDYASQYSEKFQVRLDWQWSHTAGTPTNVQVTFLDQAGDAIITAKTYTSGITTTASDVDVSFEANADVTRIQVDFERQDSQRTGTITIAHLDYSVSFHSSGAGEIADDSIEEEKLHIVGAREGEDVLIWDGTDMRWSPKTFPFDYIVDSGLQVAVTTGTPTLAQAQALTYGAAVPSTGTARTGRVLVFRANTSLDTDDYLLHIGNPVTVKASQMASNVLPVQDMVEVGEDVSHRYYRTNGLTIPAHLNVIVMKYDSYARKTIETLYESEGTHGTVQDVTGSAPVTVTGTTSKNVQLDNNGILPSLLAADTDDEKRAMRERIEAAWLAGVDKQIVVPQFTQGAGSAGSNYDYQETFDTAFVNYADGRPFEVSLAVEVQGTPNTSNITVNVSIMDTGLTTTYDTEDVTSTTGEATTVYISASLPSSATGYVLRTVRKTGTIGYRASAEGIVQVVPKTAGAPEVLTWNPTRDASLGTLPSSATVRVDDANAVKQGGILFLNATIYVSSTSNIAHRTFYLPLPTGLRGASYNQYFVIHTSSQTYYGKAVVTDTNTDSLQLSSSFASSGYLYVSVAIILE